MSPSQPVPRGHGEYPSPVGVSLAKMFALQEIKQMERAMCSYLEWQLNVEPSTLRDFRHCVQPDCGVHHPRSPWDVGDTRPSSLPSFPLPARSVSKKRGMKPNSSWGHGLQHECPITPYLPPSTFRFRAPHLGAPLLHHPRHHPTPPAQNRDGIDRR